MEPTRLPGEKLMMRTIEILLVIIIMIGAFTIASFFAVLPQPQQVSPMNLRRLSLTTLEMLDTNYNLSGTVFKPLNDPAWNQLQIALSASLPTGIVYNLTVYQVLTSGTQLYTPIKSISNVQSLGVGSDSSTYLATSSNVTFNAVAEKIGSQGGGGTLYILNCSDTNGWWITGYTVQSLAQDFYNLLSPYFQRTIMVQTTAQLGQILNNTALQGEKLRNATIINTCGEALPIPSGYYATQGYDSQHTSYAKYCNILGQKVRQYNWTWVSIVGYPLYYVSNTGLFSTQQNSWGIYGMKMVDAAGLNAFLQGIDGQSYTYDNTWITGSPGLVYLSSNASYYCNYYGIYPSPYQTATRALPDSIRTTYHLTAASLIFNEVNNWIAGAVYKNRVSGSFLALGLARTPDIRLATLGILFYFKPRLYRSGYTASGTSRLVVLQLAQVGGA
jgi:hypothetical protein